MVGRQNFVSICFLRLQNSPLFCVGEKRRIVQIKFWSEGKNEILRDKKPTVLQSINRLYSGIFRAKLTMKMLSRVIFMQLYH